MKHYDHLLSPVAVFGRDLTINYFNAAFATFFQLSPRKLRGRSISEVLGDECDAAKLAEECFARGDPIVSAEVKVRGAAEAKEVVLKLFPIEGAADAPVVALTIQDFSIERVLHQKHRLQLEELKAKNEEIKRYSESLELLVEARTQELRLERDETDSILRSLTQGLIVVEPNLCLSGKVSSCTNAMLGRESLVGLSVLDVLFPAAHHTELGDDRKVLESFLVSAFNLFIPDQFEDFVRFAPQRIRFPDAIHKGSWKIYALNFSSVVENDTIAKVLIALRDDTELEELRQHAVTIHRKIIESLEIVASGRGNLAFARFAAEMAKLATNAKNAMERLNPGDVAEVFRVLHTIKGGCRTFNLSYLQYFAHEAESFVESRRSGKEMVPEQDEKLREHLQWLERGLAAIEHLVGGVDGDRRGHDELSRAWRSSVEVIKNGFAQLAEDLGKRARLAFSSSQALSDEERIFLEKVLVHMLGNALDHGIESPEARLAVDKHPEAAVSVRVTDEGDIITVLVDDDGQGIDRTKVRNLAIKRGLLRSDVGSLSHSQVMDILAETGFSTKEKLTEVSGRGIGLEAVRTALRDRGGDLVLVDTGASGTRFQLFWRKQISARRAS